MSGQETTPDQSIDNGGNMLDDLPKTALQFLHHTKGLPDLSLDVSSMAGYSPEDESHMDYGCLAISNQSSETAREAGEFLSGLDNIERITFNNHDLQEIGFNELSEEVQAILWNVSSVISTVKRISSDRPLVETEYPLSQDDYGEDNALTIDANNGEIYPGHAIEDATAVIDQETLAAALLVAQLEHLEEQYFIALENNNTPVKWIVGARIGKLKGFLHPYFDERNLITMQEWNPGY